MSLEPSAANSERGGWEWEWVWEGGDLSGGRLQFCLVGKKAGEGLPEVANGLGLGLVLLAVAPGARDPAEERGVAEGVEGIG